MLTEWVVGYIIGVLVVVIIVVLATILILQARKIAFQATDIFAALEESRDHTEGLWEMDSVNRSLRSIGAVMREARLMLTGGVR